LNQDSHSSNRHAGQLITYLQQADWQAVT